MIVCQCNGVSDRKIRKVVRLGASTPSEVARSCGAGTCCGGCRPIVKQILRNELAERDSAPTAAQPAPSQRT